MAADASSASTAPAAAVAEVDDEAPMLSDAEAEAIVRTWGLDPANLRATFGSDGMTVWHEAGRRGDIDMCRWLKAQGLLDMINNRNEDGETPLMGAIGFQEEDTAKWMVANGADLAAVDTSQRTAFYLACKYMSFAFVQDLADKVPPEHLSLPNRSGTITSIRAAFVHNDDRRSIVQVLDSSRIH